MLSGSAPVRIKITVVTCCNNDFKDGGNPQLYLTNVLWLWEQESQLEDERGKNEQLKEEADLLRRKAQLLDQVSVELLKFLYNSVQLNSYFCGPPHVTDVMQIQEMYKKW